MFDLLLLIVTIVAALALAMRQSPLWHCAVLALVIGLLSRVGFNGVATD